MALSKNSTKRVRLAGITSRVRHLSTPCTSRLIVHGGPKRSTVQHNSNINTTPTYQIQPIGQNKIPMTTPSTPWYDLNLCRPSREDGQAAPGGNGEEKARPKRHVSDVYQRDGRKGRLTRWILVVVHRLTYRLWLLRDVWILRRSIAHTWRRCRLGVCG